MRQSRRTFRIVGAAVPALVVAALSIGAVTGFGSTPSADGSVRPPTTPTTVSTRGIGTPVTTPTPTTVAAPKVPTTAPKQGIGTPVSTAPPAPARFATGNARLDALLPTLPAELFAAGAVVHFGYNPLDDCCHSGGYNPGPNEVWVSQRALTTNARLVYVTVHELAHSLHLHSSKGAALTAAVAGAPVVRAGSPWDDSEKVADCVAWVLYPAETAASGITYWNCPDPWRTQVRAALD
jgi:hypothetical protein